MKIISVFIFFSLLFHSCDPGSPEGNNINDEIAYLKAVNDSLKAELAYVAELNENIYQEREAVKQELSSLKKKYNIRSQDGDPLTPLNLSMTRSKTGYLWMNSDGLFLPAITIEFKNTSSEDLNTQVVLKYVFINKKTSEQIYENTRIFASSYETLVGGLTKQITESSDMGWYALKDQEVSVRIYINDTFWKEFSIETSTYEGRI